MTAFRFYLLWFRLGRAYWKARDLWTLMAWLETINTPPAPQSVGDQMAAWLAAQEDEETA